MKILVTGAKGFVGKNLCAQLKNIRDGKAKCYGDLTISEVYEYDMDSTPEELDQWCKDCTFVFNLAGVNRPQDSKEFMEGNFGFASTLLNTLKKHHNTCPVMLSSSQQASLTGRFGNSEYGRSKKAGEDLFLDYGKETGASVKIYRFPNLFGKWCRPNYNSAVATFCNNIANDLPIQVNDPSVELELLYIDDLVDEMIEALKGKEHRCEFNGLEVIPMSHAENLSHPECSENVEKNSQSSANSVCNKKTISQAERAEDTEKKSHDSADSACNKKTISQVEQEKKFHDSACQNKGRYCYCPVTHKVLLGDIVDLLHKFAEQPKNLTIPEIPNNSFAKKLYSTYLSYLPKEKVAFPLKMNVDQRGSFTEMIHTEKCGQVSINISKPGITKGQHWHHTKWEFFIVVAGHGLIQQRNENDPEGKILEFEVSGDKIQCIHMLPGYTHNIINLSDTQDLVTVMYCNEIFNPNRPDTYFDPVVAE